jgi:hypothetical protein
LLRARLRRILSGSLSGACWRLPGQEIADLPGAPGFAVKRIGHGSKLQLCSVCPSSSFSIASRQ